MVNSDVLTAGYTITYQVTFDENATDEPGTYAIVTVPAQNSTGNNMPSEPTRNGYTFKGWNTVPDGNGTVFDKDTLVTGNITVYAQWEEEPA